jgi:hypothetical protein
MADEDRNDADKQAGPKTGKPVLILGRPSDCSPEELEIWVEKMATQIEAALAAGAVPGLDETGHEA